jgi:hypothetical protein
MVYVGEQMLGKIPAGEYAATAIDCNEQTTGMVMLVSPQQLTSRMIIGDAQRLRKKSRELRHQSRNIRGVSVLWMEISEDLMTTLLTNRSQRVTNGIKDANGCTHPRKSENGRVQSNNKSKGL